MHTSLLKARSTAGSIDFCAVSKSFHMGEWLKSLLEKRHIKVASLARDMGVEPGSFQSYYTSQTLSDDVLRRISIALDVDVFTMAKNEQARQMGLPTGVDNAASEPMATYGLDTGADSWLLTLKMDEFPDEVQLQLIRFVQQLPRRDKSKKKG